MCSRIFGVGIVLCSSRRLRLILLNTRLLLNWLVGVMPDSSMDIECFSIRTVSNISLVLDVLRSRLNHSLDGLQHIVCAGFPAEPENLENLEIRIVSVQVQK